MHVIQLLGSAVGMAFLSGINLYAAVLTVGLGVRLGIIELPNHLQGLLILSDPIILIIASIFYIVEFVADKIPWVDSLWDSFHTLIRPIGGAMVGMTALGGIEPASEVIAFLMLGGIGLASHSAKASTRIVANNSPEPASNIILSIVEDVVVVTGIWCAISYPEITFAIVTILLLCIILFLPKIVRFIRLEITSLLSIIKKYARIVSLKGPRSTPAKLPKAFAKYLPDHEGNHENTVRVRCFTGQGTRIGKNYPGYLCYVNERLIVLAKKRFRVRVYNIAIDNLKKVELKKKLLFDSLCLIHKNGTERFHCPKDQSAQLNLLVTSINELILQDM